MTDAMSKTDIPKLRPEVVDVILPKVIEDMSLLQLQVKAFVSLCHYDYKKQIPSCFILPKFSLPGLLR